MYCCANFPSNLKLNYWVYSYVQKKKNFFFSNSLPLSKITFKLKDEFIIILELSSYRCASSEGQQVNSFILCHSLTKISKCQEELNQFFFWNSSSLSTTLNLTTTRLVIDKIWAGDLYGHLKWQAAGKPF